GVALALSTTHGPVSTGDDLLMALVRADADARPERPRFAFVKGINVEAVLHPNWSADVPCAEADLLDLEDAGFLRMDRSGKTLTFDVTEKGRKRAAQLESATRASAGGLVDSAFPAWERDVLPVLFAGGRAY